MYIQKLVYVMRLCLLAVGRIGMEFHPDPATSQST